MTKRAITKSELEDVQSGLYLLRDSLKRQLNSPSNNSEIKDFYQKRLDNVVNLITAVTQIDIFTDAK